MNDLISIIIPNYNRADLIGETLQSIQGQSCIKWEAIVVDDGSTDNSIEVVTRYAQSNPRIKVLERERGPAGAPTCRNIGIDNAEGAYLLFLDSDDVLAPDCLQNRINFAKENLSYDIYAFPAIRFKDRIENTSTLFYANYSQLHIIAAFLLRPQWCISGSLIRKQFLDAKNIRFTEGLTKWQDWEFHLRILIRGAKCLRGPEKPDVFLRMHVSPYRINNIANKKNTAHSSIISLMETIKKELVDYDLFHDKQIAAFFCRCYELVAFLINSKNPGLAKSCVEFMYKEFPKRYKKRLLVLSTLVHTLHYFPRFRLLQPIVYEVLIKNLRAYRKKILHASKS